MDDRTTRDQPRGLLGSLLGGWRGARPATPPERENTYPVPPFEPDPIEGHPLDRLMERLKFQHRMREFEERRARRREYDT